MAHKQKTGTDYCTGNRSISNISGVREVRPGRYSSRKKQKSESKYFKDYRMKIWAISQLYPLILLLLLLLASVLIAIRP